jgi:outer membrane protein TolC
MLALIGARVAAAEEDLAGQLKTLQKERVKVLAELVEIRAMQYKVATHPCEFVAGAEADLAKAQLDATDNREGRIAVLEESAKRFAELLKIAEARLEVGTAPEADVYRLRSLLLGAKVRLLRERGANDRAADEIKALQKERGKALTELVELSTPPYRLRTLACEFLMGAEADLVNAQLDATDKREGRIAVLEEGAKREAELLRTAEGKLKAGAVARAAVYCARASYNDTKVRLLRERGPNADAAAQIKAAQHEQVEALTQLVKLALEQYEKGTTEVDAVVSAETALINAQVNAADTSEAKILVLTNAAEKETDLVKITEAKFNAGAVGSAEIDRARSLLLDAKIRLLRERTLQKPVRKGVRNRLQAGNDEYNGS